VKHVTSKSPITIRETDLPALAGVSSSIAYECRSESGAILALKDGHALSERLDPATIRRIKKHLVKKLSFHLESCGQEQNGSITVVTETITTGDYQAMVVTSSGQSSSISAGGGIECLINGELGIKFVRTSSQSIFQSSGHHHRKDSKHCKGHGQCDNESQSQCIFVNILVARKRSLIGRVKIMKAAAEPREFKKGGGDGSDSDDTSLATRDDEMALDDEEHHQHDIFEEISDFIFEVSPRNACRLWAHFP
jgi:hypothetical protein